MVMTTLHERDGLDERGNNTAVMREMDEYRDATKPIRVCTMPSEALRSIHARQIVIGARSRGNVTVPLFFCFAGERVGGSDRMRRGCRL